MSNLYRLISKAPGYVRSFGLLSGVHLLYAIERSLPHKSSTVSEYTLPDFVGKIHLRNQVSDHATFWQCLVQKQYKISEFPQFTRLMETYRDIISSGQTPLIIDCGANIGLATLWYANEFPKAVIVAIEPDEENFSLLKRNVRHLENRVVSLQGAIWPHQDQVRITNPDSGSAAFRVETLLSADPDAIRAYTVEEICEMVNAESPFIVKIDIEGAQQQLFSEGTSWVEKSALIALELDDWQFPWKGTSRPFFSCLSGYPFDYLIKGETIFCFRDFTVD